MRVPARFLTTGAALVITAFLSTGCGGASPAADTDLTDAGNDDVVADPIPPEVVEPPERDDTPIYVDPNEE